MLAAVNRKTEGQGANGCAEDSADCHEYYILHIQKLYDNIRGRE